jgi:tetratricopeptide (TPR) repeat protein
VEVLNGAAETYSMVRQFPAALKLYDRALDIKPNDPDFMAAKAASYQAQGNLQEAARFLSGINETSSWYAFDTKILQLRLERNYGEAVRLLQARLAQSRYASEQDKGVYQMALAFTQRLAGDSAGAKITAEQVRDTLEPMCKNQPDNTLFTALLSLANAVLGEKDSALKLAEHAIKRLPGAKDAVMAPRSEENLALIEMFGENSRAISTLTQLLQTPYNSWLYYASSISPALLRLDPIWDPLRGDPAFQKPLRGKAAMIEPSR